MGIIVLHRIRTAKVTNLSDASKYRNERQDMLFVENMKRELLLVCGELTIVVS